MFLAESNKLHFLWPRFITSSGKLAEWFNVRQELRGFHFPLRSQVEAIVNKVDRQHCFHGDNSLFLEFMRDSDWQLPDVAPLAYACSKPGWIWGFLFPFFLKGVGKCMNPVKFQAQEVVV